MKFFRIASIFIALLFASGHAGVNRISASRMFPQKTQVSHVVSHKMLGTKSHTLVSSDISHSKITASNGTKKSGTKSTNKKESVHPKISHKSKLGTTTTTTTTRYITKMIKKPETVMISKPKSKLVTKKKPELATKPWSKVITKSWARMISKPAPKPAPGLPSDTLYWPYRDNQSNFMYYPGHKHRLGGIYNREGPTGPLYSHTTPIGSLYPTHETFFASPHTKPTPRDLRRSPKKPASQPLKETVLSLQKSKAGLLHESTIINQDLLLLKAEAIHQKEIANDEV
jgi:hypothetical protein